MPEGSSRFREFGIPPKEREGLFGHKEKRGPYWEFHAPEQIKSPEQAELCLWWVPRKKDVLKMLEVAKQVHRADTGYDPQELWVLDVGGRSGFIDKLLVDAAREQDIALHAVIVDPDRELIVEASNYYKEREVNLHFVQARAEEAKSLFTREFDLLVNSYMWGDWGDDIRATPARARIYIRDFSSDPSTGTPEAYEAGADFVRYGAWMALHGNDIRTEEELEAFKAVRTRTLKIGRQVFRPGPKDPSYPGNIIEVQVSKTLLEQPRFEHDLDTALIAIDQKKMGKRKLYPWERRMEPDYPFMHFRMRKVHFDELLPDIRKEIKEEHERYARKK